MHAMEATKTFTGLPAYMTGCSEFKIYDGRHTGNNVIDYYECRLKKLCGSTDDPLHRGFLETLLNDYYKGNIALAWHRGSPIYVCVKDEQGNPKSLLGTQAHG